MSEIAEINLTKGLVAIIDAGDFSWLSKFRWRASESSSARFYAARTVRIDGVERNFYMHRVITGAPAGFDVDHINGDPRKATEACGAVEFGEIAPEGGQEF